MELTPRQHRSLPVIRCFPGRDVLTFGVLAERLHIQPNSEVGLVDRPEAAKFVTRAADADNRRQVCASLIARELSPLQQPSTVHRAELRRFGPRLRELLKSLED